MLKALYFGLPAIYVILNVVLLLAMAEGMLGPASFGLIWLLMVTSILACLFTLLSPLWGTQWRGALWNACLLGGVAGFDVHCLFAALAVV